MNRASRLAVGSASMLATVALLISGCGSDEPDTADTSSAAAVTSTDGVVDYNALLIEASDIDLPNDSFTAPAASSAPSAQQGASTLFTNTDGTRRIGIVIAALPDADSAAMALENMASTLPSAVTQGDVQNVDVGDRAHMIAGDSFEAGKSITVIVFQQGTTATTMQFDGSLGDPVPADWAIALAQTQAARLASGS